MKTLIAGMGFGKVLYGNIYKNMGWDIEYLDPFNKEANYKTFDDVKDRYDTVHICTPNYSHYVLSDKAAKVSKFVFVEKPGVATSSHWEDLLKDNSKTRIMMTKNNQHRSNINEMQDAATDASVINFHWINNNRIPKPGSWFTAKHSAFGGVSRDLMPHMLSLYQMLNPDWKDSALTGKQLAQRWTLDSVADSGYGEVDPKGIYNVDDYCMLQYNEKYNCVADWRSMNGDDIAIHVDDKTFELGLCPEEAYQSMIQTALDNENNEEFWQQQKDMDLWIHQQLEALSEH
jgi:predicted dehydrogenase